MPTNNQEVGLEAAILQRVRNSSLVECKGTDNVARLKHHTEAMDLIRRDCIYRVRMDPMDRVHTMRW